MTAPYVVVDNLADRLTLSGGLWSSTLPLSNLQNADVGIPARSQYSTHGSCWLKGTGGSGPARVVGFINDNLTGEYPGTLPVEATEWRVRTIFRSYASPAVFFPRSGPLAVLASTNLSGAASTLQDPDPEQPDSTGMSAVSPTANTDLRLSFSAATCGLKTGAGLQVFYVVVQRTGGGGSNPTVTVSLYKSGVLVSTLVSGQAVSSTTGALLTLTWNASLLGGSPPSAAGVELRIQGTASATATVEPRSVQWAAEYFEGVSNGATVRDSTWITRTLPAMYWGPPRSLAQLYLLKDLGGNYDLNEIFVEFHAASNADGYFQAGRFVVGAGETFLDSQAQEVPQELSWSIRLVSRSLREETRSGAVDCEVRKPYRRLEFGFPYSHRSTAMSLIMDKLGRYAETTRDCLWVMEPDFPNDYNNVACWGKQEDLDAVTAQSTSPITWGHSFAIRETI